MSMSSEMKAIKELLSQTALKNGQAPSCLKEILAEIKQVIYGK